MNIQIFGKAKCFDTKKAERFFKERRIKYQFVDIAKYGIRPGEYRSVKKAVGGYQEMLDPRCKEEEYALLPYLADESAVEEKILENPGLLKTPIVRNGKRATVGYCPEIWSDWE